MQAVYVQEGNTLDYVNPTDKKIIAGTLVMLAAAASVAAEDIEPGELGSVTLIGAWEIPKDASAFAMGEKVYYDASADKATAAVKDNVLGIAADAAAEDAETVIVRLNG